MKGTNSMNRDSANGQNKPRAAAPGGERKPRSSGPRAAHKSDAPRRAANSQDGAKKPAYKGTNRADKTAFDKKNVRSDKPSFEKKNSYGEKPAFERKNNYGNKPFDKKGGYSDKPAFERKNNYGDKPSFDKKGGYGDKPSFERKKNVDEKRGFDRSGNGGGKPCGNDRPGGRCGGNGERGPEQGSFRKPGGFDDRRRGDRFDNPRNDRRDERRSSYRDLQPESDRMWNMEMRREERWENNHMMIGTARDAALEALRDVVRNDAYASQALDRCLNNSNLSQEDRRLAASICYFSVENRLYIEWALGQLMQSKPEPVVNDIMHVAAAHILLMDRVPDHAAVDEAVKQVRGAKREGLVKLVNVVLRSLVRARDGRELVLPDKSENPE